MRARHAVALFAAVLAPLAAIAWLMIRDAEHAGAELRAGVDAVLAAELEALAGQLDAVMRSRAAECTRVLDGLALDPGAIRDAVRTEPTIRQLFVVGADGRLVHPPLDAARNEGEEAFLRRTERIWAAGAPFALPSDRAGGGGDPAPRGGWYTWYWGDGVNFIYWRLDGEGRVRGAELDRMLLLADLVGGLPETRQGDAKARRGRIELAAADGAAIYAFGEHLPPPGARPRVTLELRPPLGAWRLRYFPSPELGGQGIGRSARRSAVAAAAALALAVAGLALYVFRAAGREAREARQRVAFVNQVSHELKTPLTNIRLYAELLEDSVDEGDPRSRRYLGVIVSESQRLSRLIGNVLTFARKQRDRLSVRRAPGRADLAVAAVLDQFAPSLAAAGIEVHADLAAEVPALVDEDAIGQIAGNLVSNVEKYAAAGKWLAVRGRRDGDRYVVEIADRGPGVPAGQRARVFEPFVRLSAAVAEGASGTGIGLTIARDLARLHGGDLELVPSAAGAAFRLTLLAPPAAGGGPC